MKTNNEASDFLRILVKEIPFGIITFDLEGIVTMINEQAIQLLEVDHDLSAAMGQPIETIIKNERLNTRIKACVEVKRKNFTIRPIELNGRFLVIKGQKLLDGMLIIVLDDTDILTAQFQATQNLILGQEAERGRLAKDIHDGVGPLMSTIRMQVDNLLHTTKNPQIKSKLDNINQMIVETSSEIRQISHDLMPSSLKDFGLITSVKNLVNKINESKSININFEHKVKNQELEQVLEINLFRIIQELINNALKHSEASQIDIQLRKFKNKIQLTYEDNGKGMDIQNLNQGMGLSNIKTRVKSLQGYFEIESMPGNGLQAHAVIPLKQRLR